MILKVVFQVDFFLETHRPIVSLLNDCEYANRKAKKIARPQFKKIITDKLLFLKRYRISKQELPHLSSSRIVLEAVDTDGEGGRLKVALKFLESKLEYDLEKNVRDEIISYHKNAAIPCSISHQQVSAEDESLSLDLQSGLQNRQTVGASDLKPLNGELQKKARHGIFKGYTKRTFELKESDMELSYRKQKGDRVKTKTVKLEKGCHCQHEAGTMGDNYSFRFSIRNSEKKILIELAAQTLEDRDRWIEGIHRTSISAAAAETSGISAAAPPLRASSFRMSENAKSGQVRFRSTCFAVGPYTT